MLRKPNRLLSRSSSIVDYTSCFIIRKAITIPYRYYVYTGQCWMRIRIFGNILGEIEVRFLHNNAVLACVARALPSTQINWFVLNIWRIGLIGAIVVMTFSIKWEIVINFPGVPYCDILYRLDWWSLLRGMSIKPLTTLVAMKRFGTPLGNIKLHWDNTGWWDR